MRLRLGKVKNNRKYYCSLLVNRRHHGYLGVDPGQLHLESPMARKKPINTDFATFDVIYQDGTLSSNRRIPLSELEGFDGDAPAKAIIEAQDRKIAALSGRARGPIKTISRTPNR